MRKYGRILVIGLALLAAVLTLTGCARRGLLERAASGEPEVVTIDFAPTQAINAMQTPESGAPAEQAETAVAPAATPKASAQTEKTDTNDANLSALMDGLDDALDELEAAISAVDQDTLTDATLTALGK